VREQDAVARLGGDEFVVVLPRLGSQAEIEHVADRLIELIKEPILADGHVVTVGASVGVAFFEAAEDDARRLLVKADIAMYAAKRDPAHPWLLFDTAMTLPADSGQHLSTHIPGGARDAAARV